MKKFLQNPILLYIAIAILAFLYMDSCHRERSEQNRYQRNLKIQQDSITSGLTKLGQVTAQKDALIVTNEELQEQLWVKDDSLQDILKRFKKVRAAFVINTEVKLEPFSIQLAPVNSAGERLFSKRTPHYTFSGAVLENSVRLDTLSLFNTQRLVLGTHKGFFNRTITAEITNSNPHIQTTDLTTQVVTERIKRFGLSVYVGAGLGPNLTIVPQYGIGGTYTFLRF